MSICAWVCSICHTPYDDKTAADNCEATHRDFKQFKIVGVQYRQLIGLYGPAREQGRMVPESIRVSFSDLPHDFAKYVLKHIGPVGL